MLEVISNLIGGCILGISTIYFGLIALNKRIDLKNPKYWVAVIVLGIVYEIIWQIIPTSSRTFLITLEYALIYILLFDVSFRKALFLSIIIIILLLIPDILFYIIFIGIFKMTPEVVQTDIAGGIIGNFCVSIILMIITYLIRKPLQKITSYKIEKDKSIIVYSILTIICIGTIAYSGFAEYKLKPELIVSLCIVIIFAIILFSFIKQKIKNNKLTNAYDGLIEFVQSYEEIVETQRITQHENKNQLISIKSKIMDKENASSIINYIDSILNENTKLDKEKYSKFKYMPSNGLKGLLYFKLNDAEKAHINVEINISKSISNSIIYKLSTEEYKQLCRVIGVYLDNAIDASAESKEKLLGIEVYKKEDDINIIISNTYKHKNVDFSKISNAGYTTKGKGHGYGLSFVKSIVNNCKRIEVINSITDKLFIQTIKIKKSI